MSNEEGSRLTFNGVVRLACLLGLLAIAPARAGVPEVSPTDFELDGPGVNVDDPCFWVDAANPSHGLVFVTTKDSGLVEAFELGTGQLAGVIPGFGRPNNCAVEGDLLLTTDRGASAVKMHHLPDFAPVGEFGRDMGDPEGIDLLHAADGRTYVYVTDGSDASVHVYDLATGALVRSFPTGFGLAIEPVAVDDLYQRIFVAREEGGGHGFGVFTPDGQLLAELHAGVFQRDTEGLALYKCGAGGYLLASDQQSRANEFEVFDRVTLAHIGTFAVQDGTGEYSDSTDGIDILQTPLPNFPNGVLAACDGCGSSLPDEMDLVSWDRVADAMWLERCPNGVAPDCVDAPCRRRVVASADAHVSAGAADVNFGAAPALEIDGDPVAEALLRFDVPDLTGYDVREAKVRLVVDRATGADSPDGGTLFATGTQWSEDAVTYSTRPSAVGLPLASAGVTTTAQAIDFDVRAALPRSGAVGFLLRSASANKGRYRSREAGESPPALLLAVQRSQPPVVAITAPADGATLAGGAVTFTGTASDPEQGNLASRLRWRSSLDGALGTGASIVVSALSTGEHAITAEVEDDAGLRAARTIRVRVGARPAVTITAPADGARIAAGTIVRLSGTATDDVDGDLSAAIVWTSDKQTGLPKGSSVTAILNEGTHQITASATNSHGATGSARITVTITPTPPFVKITAPAAGPIISSTQSLTLSGSAGDATDGTLTSKLVWTSDLQGALGTGATVVVPSLVPGTHVVTASATDSGGLVGRASVAVRVIASMVRLTPTADAYVDQNAPSTNNGAVKLLQAKSAPEMLSFLRFGVNGMTGGILQRATLELTVSTSSGSQSVNGGSIRAISDTGWQEMTITYDTRPPLDGAVVASHRKVALGDVVDFDVTSAVKGDGPLVLALSTTSNDTVKYKSREATGGPALTLSLDTAPVTGAAPVVSILAPGAGSILPGDRPITLRGRATDAEDGDISSSITWASDRAGALGSGPSLSVTLPAGMYRLLAIASDRSGRVGISEITFTVNGVPQVAITAPADGAAFPPGQPVRLQARAIDGEDGDLSAAVVWTSDRDGALGVGPSLLAPLTAGVHRITASATDGAGQQGSAAISVRVEGSILTFTPTADATVKSELPATNYGTTLSLQADADPARRAYLRFSVAGIGAGNVTRAVLRLTVESDSASGSVSGGTLYRVTGPWEERVVTFASSPPFDATPLASAGRAVPGQAVEFDLTGVVTGDGTYDIALVTALDDKVSYASREAGASAPRLFLTIQ